MELILSWNNSKNVLLFLFLSVLGSSQSFSYPEEKVEDMSYTWPVGMTFHETKTNSMLGEALLKRIYSRIEHTENLFRVEIGQVYDKLKQDIQKNFRKCDRKRRKADHLKDKNNFHSNKEGSEKQKQKRDKKKSNKRKDKKSDREREAGAKRPYESWADRDDFPSQLYQSQYR